MVLKLFSPQEIKNSKEEELAKDVLRTKSIKEAKANAEKELNTANAAFESALANQRMRWMSEEKEATDKLQALYKEIAELEERKKNIPIEYDKKKLDNLIKEAEEALLKANAKAEENDLLYDVLSNRIDELTLRDQALNDRELKILVREKSQEEERLLIKENQKKITEALINTIKQ